MKILFIAAGVLATVGTLYLLWPSEQPQNDTTPFQETNNTFPINKPSNTTEPTWNQNASGGTRQDVADSMVEQIETPLPVTPGYTIVVSNYALQQWSDEFSGGEVLLKYEENSGWKVIPEAAVVWSVDDLKSVGVPLDVAKQLVSGRK